MRKTRADDLKACRICALTGEATPLGPDGRCPYERVAHEENARVVQLDKMLRVTSTRRRSA